MRIIVAENLTWQSDLRPGRVLTDADEPAVEQEEQQHIRIIEPDLDGHPDLQLAIREAALIRPKHTPTARVMQSQRIWQAGHAAQLVRNATGRGLRVKSLELDSDAWTRLITGGLQSGVIRLQ